MKSRDEIHIGIMVSVALFLVFIIMFSKYFLRDPVELYNVTNNVSVVSEYSAEKKININRATLEELIELDGIGEVTAARIIEYREANGDFEFIEDLAYIKGISEATVEKLRPYISVK